MEKRAVELVVLFGNEVERVWPLLEGYQFDDNGGEPDGPAWLALAEDFTPEELDSIVAGQLGYVTTGYEFGGYDGSDEARGMMKRLSQFRWCGYSSRDVAYYVTDLQPDGQFEDLGDVCGFGRPLTLEEALKV